MLVSKNALAAVMVSSMVAMGCSSSNRGDSEEGGDTGGATAGTTGGTDTGGTTGETGGGTGIAEFDGNWTQPCEGDGDGVFEDEAWEVVNLAISGGTVTSDNFTYTDSACTIPDVPALVTITATLEYPGGTSNTSLGVARHVNATTTEVLIDGAAPTTEQEAFFQSLGTYDTEYDLILISSDNLYLGELTDLNDGETEATRPIDIDQDDFFVRQ